jgi:hypothetical protein
VAPPGLPPFQHPPDEYRIPPVRLDLLFVPRPEYRVRRYNLSNFTFRKIC